MIAVGQNVTWTTRHGREETVRRGRVVFVRGENDTDATLDAAMQAAGWTGAVRGIRWRRHAGAVPEVVVYSERQGRPAFFAPELAELHPEGDAPALIVEWDLGDPNLGLAPPEPAEAPAAVATVIVAGPSPVESPPSPAENEGGAIQIEPLTAAFFQRRAELRLPPGAGVAERGLGRARTLLHRLSTTGTMTAVSRLPLVAAAPLPRQPTEVEAAPVDAPRPRSREATREAMATEIRRFLDGIARTRDELFQLVTPMFDGADYRIRETFSRALDKLVSDRAVIRAWIDTEVGPIYGYIAR